MHPLNGFARTHLIVKKIPLTKEHRTIFAKVALCWHETAEKKFYETPDPKQREVFWDSRHITRLVAKSLQSRRYKRRFSSMYVSFDEKTKTIHSIVLTKKHTLKTCVGTILGNYLKVVLIATNPINIRACCNNDEPNRVQGAASCLVRHLRQCSVQMKLDGLYLESIKSAIRFYKKMHFFLYEPTTIQMAQKRTYPMILPVHVLPEKPSAK